jgi:long-chain acyl-CoA synthetase
MAVTTPDPIAAPAEPSGGPTVSKTIIRSIAAHRGDALRYHRDGGWRELSYAEVGRGIQEIARGLIALGVRPGDRVSILSGTRPAWTLADLGALCAGAVVAPIYQSNSADECQYVLEHADARLVFCEDASQLAKVEQIRDRCPQLEHVVMFDGQAPGALSLQGLRDLATGVDPLQLEAIADRTLPGDPATIVYTSGTTGPPKGCVTTHENLIGTTRAYERQLRVGPGSVVYLFLPLAHTLARVTQMVALDVGATIAYWRGETASVPADLREAGVTHLPVVPRVLEKIHREIAGRAQDGGRLSRVALRWAIGSGARRRAREHARRRVDPLTRISSAAADKLVLAKVRDVFGPDLQLVLTGAAPIAQELLEFFDACGVLVLEGYGLSESTAAATLNTEQSFRFGTVGRALPNVELAIAADGEVLIRGPNVFAGYFKDEAATSASLTDDGYLRSGDLGSLDADGFLRITGRKKDIIITSGGKNIAPANLEAALREITWVSEAVVFGDGRQYLVALLTLDPGLAPVLAGSLGVEPDVRAMASDPRVHAELMREVDRVNERFARVEQIKRIAILDHDLSQQSGELTPTQKTKRAVVYAKYRDVIDALYE